VSARGGLALLLAAAVALPALWPPARPPDVPPAPRLAGAANPAAALLDLVLPGVYTPPPDLTGRPGPRSPVADALQLPDPQPGRPLLPLQSGATALLLALYAALAARGRAALALRAALACGLLLLLAGPPPDAPAAGRVVLLLALAGLAACGLRRLDLHAGAPPRGTAELLLGAGCVALAALAALLALRAGRASDAVLAEPLVRRLAERLPPAGGALQLAEVQAAGAVRLACDRAALSAFAAMTALLLHLKSRSPGSALLVVGVAAAELLLPRLLG